ncbi:MAG: PAS domain S-box protein [Byssovorax sp.]
MLEFLAPLFSSNEFMPHGHCYLWQPGVIWLHVTSDAIIALAYTTIPFTLLYFVRRRRDLPFHWIFLCFGVFIVACGATHYLEILTLWAPWYWLSGAVKAITAVASLLTAVLLVRLVPRALALPSPGDLRRAAEALRVSEARFRAAMEAGLDAFFVMEAVRDPDGVLRDFNVVEMNTAGASLIAQPGHATPRASQRGRFGHHPDLVAKHRRVIETRTPLEEEVEIDLHGAGRVWFHHQVVPVGDGVAITLRDITRSRKAEHARLLAAIVASSDDAIVGQAMDGTIESWNAGAEALFGYSAAEMLGRGKAPMIPTGAVDEAPGLLSRLVAGERVEAYETRRTRKDGALIDVAVRVSPIRDEHGVIIGVAGIGRDITARNESDRRLKASLVEKEILLKEVHHRVKNNLQVISSLLNIEAGRMVHPEAIAAFRKSQTRVRSIAAFHEGAYQATDLAHVDMGRYLDDLVRGVRSTYGALGEGVRATVDAASVVLGADLAIPCGLIANELITNAFKHAFPDGHGTVGVTLSQRDGELVLRVVDDGVGLPQGFDLASLTSLGLQLVQTLSEQIRGALRVDRGDPGAAFTVTFRASN